MFMLNKISESESINRVVVVKSVMKTVVKMVIKSEPYQRGE